MVVVVAFEPGVAVVAAHIEVEEWVNVIFPFRAGDDFAADLVGGDAEP